MGLILFQLFFPYLYFSSSDRNSNAEFQVGIHYVYEQDSVSQIYNEVAHIHDLGFKVIRITLEYNEFNPESSQRTDAFYSAAQSVGIDVALAIQNHLDFNTTSYYLNRWGKNAAYILVLNEPESSQSWDVGALFTDDEIMTKFKQTYALVEPHRTHAKFYTNFGAGFMVRSNLPIKMSERLDFVG
jgi:hypothetical protein